MNQNNILEDQLDAKSQLIEQFQQDKEALEQDKAALEREVLAAKSALSTQIEKVEEIKKTIIEESQQKEVEKDTIYDENDQLVEDIIVPEENPEEENEAEVINPLEDEVDEIQDEGVKGEEEGLQEEDEDDLNLGKSTTSDEFGAPSDEATTGTATGSTATTTSTKGIAVNADLIRAEDSSSFISSLNDPETGNFASNVKEEDKCTFMVSEVKYDGRQGP